MPLGQINDGNTPKKKRKRETNKEQENMEMIANCADQNTINCSQDEEVSPPDSTSDILKDVTPAPSNGQSELINVPSEAIIHSY